MLRSIAARMSHVAIHALGPRCDASRSMGRPWTRGAVLVLRDGRTRSVPMKRRRPVGVRPPQDEDGREDPGATIRYSPLAIRCLATGVVSGTPGKAREVLTLADQ